MADPKQQLKPLEETTKQPVPTPKQPVDEAAALKAELEALKAGQKEFEDKTLAAALAKVGISAQDFLEMERVKKSADDVLEVDIGAQVVHINGIPFTGTVRVPRPVAEMIQSMAGNARNQRLRELVGNNYQVDALASGGIKTRLIGKSEESLG